MTVTAVIANVKLMPLRVNGRQQAKVGHKPCARACSICSRHGSRWLAAPLPLEEPVCGLVGDFGGGDSADPAFRRSTRH